MNENDNISKVVIRALSDMKYRKDNDGRFLISLSADDISKNSWREILCPCDSETSLELRLKSALDAAENELYDNLARSIFRKSGSEYKNSEFEKILYCVKESTAVDYCLDDILNSSIKVNIGVETGDSYCDFSANTVPPAYCADHYIVDTPFASIVWLAKQQGHKLGELVHALRHIKKSPDTITSPLLYSIAYEVWHAMTELNQLFFLVSMPVYRLLYLNELIRWSNDTNKWGGYIVLDKSVTAGLYDFAAGATSLMEIEPEHSVKLPIKYIYCILPDSCFRYPIMDITCNEKLWDNCGIVYQCAPKKFRQSFDADNNFLKKQLTAL